MGLFSRNKPKIKVQTSKKDGFSGWVKCSGCSELIHANELSQNINCCPKCDYHYRLSMKQRLQLLADEGTFREFFDHIKPTDALNFVDTESYKKRIEDAVNKTSRDDAVCVGKCLIGGHETALGILDFSFMGGSMGSVVGERLTCLIELAIEEKLPLVIVSASGGARMQESILSLMQMAKTSAALAKLHEKGLPYISILTNPTTGGVTASFATLGDIIVAEPDALIAFAGPRVVEQTIGQKLPPRAQKSEFLLEKGMVDCIVKRSELKSQVAFFLDFLTKNERVFEKDELAKKIPSALKKLLRIAEETHV
ncbi:MAG: acetyl-CoA carboxylase carboxyl transferase subunit beta [Chlamydiae bacterium CG10_big_fil_rev_8_21_14_0_10_42_34]|nr:MAG: acetyl-CoA carboxylase carboxyl transferase subunit beta [Chlamydiae bacterium CG10_big_fil_rev_8_21_14_0_10_42_34]